MKNTHKKAYRRLYSVADKQQGFFTTKQAIAAGFAERTHPYHVNVGNWIREHRGIYRLADFPTAERPDLMLWYLWSQNRKEVPEGTYSHDTAQPSRTFRHHAFETAADRSETLPPQ